ncbi:MAG: antibiotic biosynthesis monooxygenase [Melioribacteraceae bacterium]|nr:antibiotic biosynthesis monooxygenase [Melioribacteraceae bacterium]
MRYITIIAEFKLLEQTDKVKEELLSLVEPTQNEKGCVDYTFYRDNDDPNILMLYENWETEEDLKAHTGTERFKDTFKRIEGLFELKVHKLTEI